MRFGPREIIFLLLLMALPALAFFLVFEPRNAQISQARAEIENKQARLTTLNEATGEEGNLHDEIQRLQTLIETSRERLPDAAQVDDILKQITELATNYKLRSERIRSMSSKTTPFWAEEQMNVVMTGDFMDFYSFLRDLENLRRITKVDKLEIQRVERDGVDEGQMRADFQLSIFFESPNQAASL